jgi:hypothetical protein
VNAADDRVPLVFEDTASAREVFLAWERWRIVYNAALVFGTVIGILLVPEDLLADRMYLRHLIRVAVLANVLYCVGPVAEGYFAWMGGPRRPIRAIVFTLGTLLATLFAFLDATIWSMRGF